MAALVPATSLANCSPTRDQYGDLHTIGPCGSHGGGGGSLPFTGFDVLLVAVIGTALLLAGFGLRRASRTRESASA